MLSFPITSHFQLMQLFDKISLINVVWYVLHKRENMHPWSPSDLLGSIGEEKPIYVHYVIWLTEAEKHISKLNSVLHHLLSVGPKQLCVLKHLGCTH